jgi:hypothetical protein
MRVCYAIAMASLSYQAGLYMYIRYTYCIEVKLIQTTQFKKIW